MPIVYLDLGAEVSGLPESRKPERRHPGVAAARNPAAIAPRRLVEMENKLAAAEKQ